MQTTPCTLNADTCMRHTAKVTELCMLQATTQTEITTGKELNQPMLYTNNNYNKHLSITSDEAIFLRFNPDSRTLFSVKSFTMMDNQKTVYCKTPVRQSPLGLSCSDVN